MVLPGLDLQVASEVAEAIRLACHGEQIQTPEGEHIGFTVSVGVAELEAEDIPDSLLRRADKALYEAKGSGRDQVHVAA